MYIAFIFPTVRTSPGDGIISQAIVWRDMLVLRGHVVDLINTWEYKDLSKYDIIQYFGMHDNMLIDIMELSKQNKNIVIAPIVDPGYSRSAYNIFSRIGREKTPRIISRFYALRHVKNYVKLCIVRSEYEKSYLVESYGYEPKKIKIIKLSTGVEPLSGNSFIRENFCLHVSRIGDENKNVKRLIDASSKYNFKLIIAGLLMESEKKKFESWCKGNNNVEYKGFVSEEEKKILCARAKVFALPSIVEGVGLSALEAATWGCDIVITKIGGPKEYYNNLAQIVDPYSIDEIGKGVRYFLDGQTFQPKLTKYIVKEFSNAHISEELEHAYKEIL